MARISVKYKIGDRVQTVHEPPTKGIVTAIFVRGKSKTYEMSFTDGDGPTSRNVSEVEIESVKGGERIGFNH